MEGQQSLEKRFIVDNMLGKLAKWLRILGFDAHCERFEREEQLDGYRRRGLLLITRNQRWLGQAQVIHLTANKPMEQLVELISLLSISQNEIRPLRRCIQCNQPLENVSRSEAFGFVPDYIFEIHTVFRRCPSCHRLFWQGSHPVRIQERLQSVLGWRL